MKAIDIKSVLNAGDLGGGKGQDGRNVRTGRVVRSAKPDRLTPEDSHVLFEQVGVKTIIDLRTEKEAKARPDITLDCKYYNIPLRPDVTEGVKYDFPSSLKTFLKKFPSMTQMYVDMLTTDYSVGQLQKIFAIIFDTVQNEECVLFHCTEGKDRTGIVAVLIEMLLGVDRDESMKNYMHSNECFKNRNRFYFFLTLIAFLDAGYAKDFKTMFEARPSMLKRVFEIIDAFGGIDAYFTEQLHFSQEDVDSFRSKMLVDKV